MERRPPGERGLMACVIVLASVLAHSASALAEVPERLSLSSLVTEARERNPELQAAQGRARAMAAVPRQAAALDDPTLSWEVWNAPKPYRIDRADNNIFRLSQKFPFPGKRRLAGKIATEEALQASHEVESVELDVVTAVKRAYFDLWEAHERLAVYTRERELVERFTRIVEQRYGTGDAVQADVIRAQVELTHLINRLQTERLTIEQGEAELNRLLSRPPERPLGVPEPPPAPRLVSSPADLTELALETRPDIAAQDMAIAREESAVQLAHRGYYPDFEVSFGRFVNFGAPDGFGAMASVTVPIFNGAKYGAAVNEASARLGAARSDKRRIEDGVRLDVEQTYLRARTALLQFELFVGTHVPQAEQALRVTEGGYEAGEVPFLDVVDTLRSIESVHLDHIAAQAEFERAYADLERAVGRELPRDAAPGSAPAERGYP